MPSTTDNNTRAVVRLLARADSFNRLAKTCPRRNRRAYYHMKDRALTVALKKGIGQFEVDSLCDDGNLALGLTHVSGRRVHVYPYRMPGEIQLLLHGLADACGHIYPLLRLQTNSAGQREANSRNYETREKSWRTRLH